MADGIPGIIGEMLDMRLGEKREGRVPARARDPRKTGDAKSCWGAESGKLLLTGDSGMMFSRSRRDVDEDDEPVLLLATGPQMLGGARPSSTWISRALDGKVSARQSKAAAELYTPL